MKIFIAGLMLVFSGTTAICQTIEINGTVNNEAGRPVPYAFVRDSQHNYATYADSTGTFALKADPASALQVSANNYKETQIKIENKNSLKVVLAPGTAGSDVTTMKSIKETINEEFLRARGQLLGGDLAGQQVRSGFVQEPTHGSRYLYADWIPGFGINGKDQLVAETSNMYNYDKVSGNIMYTGDGKSLTAVSSKEVKSFSLFDKSGHPHVYENAPAISGAAFVEVLLSTPKYKIYKKVDCKLSRADFHTDGVIEMGHRYDEYVDNIHYYFVGADGKSQSISLKKSTLKKLLGGDADSFIASQGSRDVDEDYVRDLGNNLAK
jgi:hypothetical protein